MAVDSDSEPDAYCVCRIFGRRASKVCTDVVKFCSDPSWSQTVSFTDYMNNDSLLFTIYDRDPGSGPDDVIGFAELQANQIYPNGFRGELPVSALHGITPHLRVTVSMDESEEQVEELS